MTCETGHKYCNGGSTAQCMESKTKVTLELPDCTCAKGWKEITCERDEKDPCLFIKTTAYLLYDGTPAPAGTTLATKKPDFSYA